MDKGAGFGGDVADTGRRHSWNDGKWIRDSSRGERGARAPDIDPRIATGGRMVLGIGGGDLKFVEARGREGSYNGRFMGVAEMDLFPGDLCRGGGHFVLDLFPVEDHEAPPGKLSGVAEMEVEAGSPSVGQRIAWSTETARMGSAGAWAKPTEVRNETATSRIAAEAKGRGECGCIGIIG